MTETPESDHTDMSVPDEDLPEDLQPDEDNPLAQAGDQADGDDPDRQDLGDPHIPGLERDEEGVSMPDADETDGGTDDGETDDGDSSGAS